MLRGEDVDKYSIKYKKLYIDFDIHNNQKFKNIELYRNKKMFIRRVTDRLIATFDSDGFIVLNTIYCCSPKSTNWDPKIIVSLINSRLIQYWFTKTFILTDKLFPYIRKSQLDNIPVSKSLFFNSTRMKQLSQLVDNAIIAKGMDQKKEYIECENQIEKIIYDVYGLTKEEIAVVEGLV